jgi:hypothetical protein
VPRLLQRAPNLDGQAHCRDQLNRRQAPIGISQALPRGSKHYQEGVNGFGQGREAPINIIKCCCGPRSAQVQVQRERLGRDA